MHTKKQVVFDTTVLWVVCSMGKDSESPTLISPSFWCVHTWMLGTFLKVYISVSEKLWDRKEELGSIGWCRASLGGSPKSKEADVWGTGCGTNGRWFMITTCPASLSYATIWSMSDLSLSLHQVGWISSVRFGVTQIVDLPVHCLLPSPAIKNSNPAG